MHIINAPAPSPNSCWRCVHKCRPSITSVRIDSMLWRLLSFTRITLGLSVSLHSFIIEIWNRPEFPKPSQCNPCVLGCRTPDMSFSLWWGCSWYICSCCSKTASTEIIHVFIICTRFLIFFLFFPYFSCFITNYNSFCRFILDTSNIRENISGNRWTQDIGKRDQWCW